MVAEDVPLSPKFHERKVMVPVDWSVNCTGWFVNTEVGDPVNAATGAAGAVTVMYPALVSVSDPPGPETVRLTLYVPGFV